MDEPFLYKYKPSLIKNMILPSHSISLIESLLKLPGISTILLGNTGCGKSTLASCIIKNYYPNTSLLLLNDNILSINCLKDQGVQFYRTHLKAFCQTRSTIPGKRKTVLVDDIDTITPQCQEVIRYCLDVYQDRINFICTASNRHKVQEPILSRCIAIKVPSPSRKDIIKLCNFIIEKEKLKITSEAYELLIKYSSNSYRLLINYLEKFKLLQQEITEDILKFSCTNIHTEIFDKYLKNCLYKKDNFKECLDQIYWLYEEGYSVTDIIDGLFSYLKYESKEPDHIRYKCIKQVCKYAAAHIIIHEHEVELAFLTLSLCNLEFN